MRRRAVPLVMLVIVVATALAGACGGNAGGSARSTTGAGGEGGARTSGDGLGEAEGITIVTATGEVSLPSPATRVVALEWVYAEDALLLGVEPVGVADRKGYVGYVGAPPPLPSDITDVGTRQEPSLEEIRALDPDLIIGVTMRHDGILGELEAIAPTALFDPYGGPESQLAEMRTTFAQIAMATGKVAEGEQVLADLDASIAAAADALASLSGDERNILVVQPYVANDVPVIRAFTGDSLTVELFEEIGLVNVWTGPGDEHGFTTTDLEGLTTVSDVSVLYTAEADDIARGGFIGNPLWERWQPVVDHRLHPLGAKAWTYGGPASAGYLLDQVVTRLGPQG